MTKAHRYGMGGLFAVLTVALTMAPVAAQDVDSRWMAFLGCWEPTGQTADSGLLCVRPMDGGVELFTVVAGEATTSDFMVANGEQRPRSIEGCDGWESSEFSRDGHHVFTRSEFVCAEEVTRTTTGVMSLTSPTQWVDVRSVDVGGEPVAWVQEYRLVGPERIAEAGVEDVTQDLGLAVRSARLSAARRIALSDVLEASEKIDAKAVEAWIAARGERFALDADALVELADAGVEESIIDVVVAVTYPETFSIDENADARARGAGGLRGSRAGYGYGYGALGRYGGRYGFGARSFFWDPFSYGYSPFYSPYSYGYGSYGYGYGGYYPTTVVVDRVPSPDRGRVVNGRGYTRGSSGSAGPRVRGGGGSRAAPSRGSSGGGGGSVGRSSGSSGGGRTARRRGGDDSF